MKGKKYQYIVKIDQTGKAVGPDAEAIRGDLRTNFAGQFVTITVVGYENPYTDEARGYYHSVVVPALINGLIGVGNEIDTSDRESVREHRKEVEEMLIKAAEEIEMVTEIRDGEELRYWPDMKDLNSKQYWIIIEDMISFCKEFLGVQDVPKPEKQKK